jgi:phosphatidate cytidylyltransferase
VKDLRRRSVTALVYGAVVLASLFAPPVVFDVLLALLGIIAIVELFGLRHAGPPVLIESLLLGMGLASLRYLRSLGDPSEPLFLVLLATWANDVAGYAIGTAFGRRKITPTLSPGKTWEGTLAGFAAAPITVLLGDAVSNSSHPWVPLLAATLGPVGFAGDLLESWIKRRAGVKDSGKLFPGHGGVLDRIDSILATALLATTVIVLGGRMG